MSSASLFRVAVRARSPALLKPAIRQLPSRSSVLGCTSNTTKAASFSTSRITYSAHDPHANETFEEFTAR